MNMREIFDKHGCDKGSKKHRYDRCYEPYMQDKREEPINILEIGCYKGESTEAWLEYFPNAQVYTIDTFERITPDEIPVLLNPRVHWISGDSTSSSLPNKIRKEWGDDIQFDFIVDDGGHWPECNHKTLQNCFPFLKEDGVYFIEDVWMLEWSACSNHYWVRKHPQRFNILDHYSLMDEVKKNDFKIYDYGNRGNGENPESVIIRIKGVA